MNKIIFDQILSDLKYALKGLQAFLASYVSRPVPPIPPKPEPPHQITLEEVMAAHPRGWRQGSLEERRKMFLLASAIAKEGGLGIARTAEYLATIAGESGWNQYCVNLGNRNGTGDYGIAQFNSATYLKEYAMSPVDALLNPEGCLRIMAENFKTVRRRNWFAYQPGDDDFERRKLTPFP